MQKQAGIGQWLASRAVPGLTRVLHGSFNLARDAGLQRTSPELYKKIRSAGQWAAKSQKGGDKWVDSFSTIPRYALKTTGFVAPLIAMGAPVIGPAMSPLYNVAEHIGNAAGQASINGDEAKQLAAAGGVNSIGSFYDELNKASYGERRNLINRPVDWSTQPQGVQQMAGKANAPQMGGAGAIWNTINPWGSGDISPYIRRQAMQQVFQ